MIGVWVARGGRVRYIRQRGPRAAAADSDHSPIKSVKNAYCIRIWNGICRSDIIHSFDRLM